MKVKYELDDGEQTLSLDGEKQAGVYIQRIAHTEDGHVEVVLHRLNTVGKLVAECQSHEWEVEFTVPTSMEAAFRSFFNQ